MENPAKMKGVKFVHLNWNKYIKILFLKTETTKRSSMFNKEYVWR